MDSSITIVDQSNSVNKKHKKKKNAKAKGINADVAMVEDESSSVKVVSEMASEETKPPKKKSKKKDQKKNTVTDDVDEENEQKEHGRRTVPVVDSTFESLRPHISEATMTAIEGFGFSEMTEVQQQTIPLLLAGRDVSAIAKTGSGKTLAFVIPAVERIKDQLEGIGCIILSPTRELAQQTYNVVRIISAGHRNLTHGIVMGGTKIEKEKAILAQGVNILVATPGRLLDHLKRTKGLRVNKLRVLVLDEADRILDAGFEKDVKQIVQRLPVARRQTMQFSATPTGSISHLCLAADYKTVNLVSNTNTPVTSELLTQTYLVVPTFQRLMVLYKILMENKDKKVMVFLNTCDNVNLYKAVFGKLGLELQSIHGRQGQQIRTNLFKEFTEAESGALLCTDIAARGWDIPAVHLIVQYDPPTDVNEYIHRVGRAARRPGEAGVAVLMLREEERSLVDLLKKKRLELTEYTGINMFDLQYDVQDKVNELVATETGLKEMAIRAYRNFLTSYAVLNPKDIYNRKTIQPEQLAKCFGLTDAPSFNYSREPLNHSEKDLLKKPKPKSHKKRKNDGKGKDSKAAPRKKGKKGKKEKVIDPRFEGESEQDKNARKKKSKERRKSYKDLLLQKKLAKKTLWEESHKSTANPSTEEKSTAAPPKTKKGEGKDKQAKPEAIPVESKGKQQKRKLQEVVKEEVKMSPKKMKTSLDDSKPKKQLSPKKKEKKRNLKKKKLSCEAVE